MVRPSVRNGKLGAGLLTSKEGENVLAARFYDGEKINPEAEKVRDEFLRGYHQKASLTSGVFLHAPTFLLPSLYACFCTECSRLGTTPART